MQRRWQSFALIITLMLIMSTTGCARQKELERVNRSQAATIVSLNDEILRLNDELEVLSESRESLANAKLELERQLQAEMAGGNLDIAMGSRGVIVTVLNNILFDSGKTDLKETSKSTLDKVAGILKAEVPEQMIYVEGHTDSDPIKRSGFKSNWELSTARATEVVHYFIEKSGVSPQRIVAAGLGEFHPVASNSTTEGKSKNRRVEIVISPDKVVKQRM